MANKVIMPKQGLQMTEGTITKWLLGEGAPVKKGEPLFSMETDKLTITMDSPFDGVLLKIVRQEWETVPITETIAIIGQPGEDISALLNESGSRASCSANSDNSASVNNTEFKADQEICSAERSRTGNERTNVRLGRLLISPRAKKLAEDNGIDVASFDFRSIEGSGEEGMIVQRDILPLLEVKATPLARKLGGAGVYEKDFVEKGVHGRIRKEDLVTKTDKVSFHSEAKDRTKGVSSSSEDTIVPIAGMRRAVCNNMMTSLHQMAQANHKIRIDMSEAVLIRRAFKTRNISVSFNDIVVMAVAQALSETPQMNAVSDEKFIYQKHNVHLGVAVALDNGLIVPTLRDADLLTLSEIHDQTAVLAQKAKQGTLTTEEYSDGTFTVTNLGMYGLDEFVAIINPPQVGILAIGAITDTPVVVNGVVVIRPIMSATLTYDHRVIDGAPAAKFLHRIKELLENPYLFLID